MFGTYTFWQADQELLDLLFSRANTIDMEVIAVFNIILNHKP